MKMTSAEIKDFIHELENVLSLLQAADNIYYLSNFVKKEIDQAPTY